MKIRYFSFKAVFEYFYKEFHSLHQICVQSLLTRSDLRDAIDFPPGAAFNSLITLKRKQFERNFEMFFFFTTFKGNFRSFNLVATTVNVI